MKKEPFKDKVIIVTGGASGIGRALCTALAQRQPKVVVVADLNMEQAETVVQELWQGGANAEAVAVDVADEAAVRLLIDGTVEKYGRLDFMFNNAGIAISGEAQDMELSHWQKMLDVSLWGVIYGTRLAYEVMLQQGSGHIINTSSASGITPVPMGLPYATAKHGVVGLSTALRMEAADKGVRVSVVCPGVIRTPIFDTSEEVTPIDRGKWLDSPMYRMMEPEDCARVILKGVAKNKGIITVTAETKMMWWIYRVSPRFMDVMGRMIARKYREMSV